jgi:23S rRNA (cytosine1962-C5)-methyltransferase
MVCFSALIRALFLCLKDVEGAAMKTLRIQPGRERRILQGHRWVFSNEVADKLSEFEPGSWVEVKSSKGVTLGTGYVNPNSLIAVRLVCSPGQAPSREFFFDLIGKAEQRRRELYYPGSRCYRAVYSESDGLPGLIVDRYEDVFVYQVTTLGMARMEPLLQEIMMELFKPAALVYRNDTQVRGLEQLPLDKGVAHGQMPDDLWVDMDGIQFLVRPLSGQKTGFYLDQRDNRQALRKWVKGKRVLDLFCYNGGWSLSAAAGGAAEVVGVDQSAEAVAQARLNASRNGFHSTVRFEEQEGFRFLKNVGKGVFDVIILDPPAFARTKSALPEAKKGYVDLNRKALLALKPGGMLVTCSCSYHMNPDLFREALLQAAQAAGRQLRLIASFGQAKDHPSLLAMPETRYLKCLVLDIV